MITNSPIKRLNVYRGTLPGDAEPHHYCVATTSWGRVRPAVEAAGLELSTYHMRDHWLLASDLAMLKAAKASPGILLREIGINANVYRRAAKQVMGRAHAEAIADHIMEDIISSGEEKVFSAVRRPDGTHDYARLLSAAAATREEMVYDLMFGLIE